ncbi:acyl-CoA dehydrogenase [Aliiroseovarius halocynthiae]|uniref:Acyl-CoA dehydrogenase n=1 Tax=Aliiroseovarius halocynthiae TaxID=985055 RepID=A0A545SX89_9RHOB|nr:acyl-CoA dehydrogenase [Aliiroseovarius halocynthiae]
MSFQNTRFTLSDLYSESAVNRAFVDGCIQDADAGKPDPKASCIAKLRTTEILRKAAAAGVQYHGAAVITGPSGATTTQDMLDSATPSPFGAEPAKFCATPSAGTSPV